MKMTNVNDLAIILSLNICCPFSAPRSLSAPQGIASLPPPPFRRHMHWRNYRDGCTRQSENITFFLDNILCRVTWCTRAWNWAQTQILGVGQKLDLAPGRSKPPRCHWYPLPFQRRLQNLDLLITARDSPLGWGQSAQPSCGRDSRPSLLCTAKDSEVADS